MSTEFPECVGERLLSHWAAGANQFLLLGVDLSVRWSFKLMTPIQIGYRRFTI
ncbi:hypothetical protein [Oceanisphaera ostreae]|uniref:Uncharacterized protein n=1 Tax=Oceanisphaera ostreae TaxID=914151 RepID=A0ABW3KKQ3_9GAMM